MHCDVYYMYHTCIDVTNVIMHQHTLATKRHSMFMMFSAKAIAHPFGLDCGDFRNSSEFFRTLRNFRNFGNSEKFDFIIGKLDMFEVSEIPKASEIPKLRNFRNVFGMIRRRVKPGRVRSDSLSSFSTKCTKHAPLLRV